MASQKQRKGFDRAGAPATGKPAGPKPTASASKASSQGGTVGIVIAAVVVAVVAIGGIFLATRGSGSPSTGTGTVVQSSAGPYTNISADRLASELQTHTFTLINVKTPYIGEIDGTDLYIPYTALATRASELPTNKTAKIVVYCRSGVESAMAVQTLLGLGYTNIENLDGGMNAWTASGRSLVQKNRT
jgi:rhodanese-related sulfurtransferase